MSRRQNAPRSSRTPRLESLEPRYALAATVVVPTGLLSSTNTALTGMTAPEVTINPWTGSAPPIATLDATPADGEPDGYVPPAARPDLFSADGGRAMQLEVLANDDRGVLAGDLRIVAVGDTRLDVTSVEIAPDGRSVRYRLREEAPSEGLAVLWPPTGAALGIDSFTYTVRDALGSESTANVYVHHGDSMSLLSGLRRYNAPQVLRYAFQESFQAVRLSDDLKVVDNWWFGEQSREPVTILGILTPPTSGYARITPDGDAILYSMHTSRPDPDPHCLRNGEPLVTDSMLYVAELESGHRILVEARLEITKPYVAKNDYGVTTVFADSATTTRLEVLKNDQFEPGSPVRIEAVQAPSWPGELTIAPDGQALLFAPNPGIHGGFGFTYTVRYGAASFQTIEVADEISIQPTIMAVDDWVDVDAGASEAILSPLDNDPDLTRWLPVQSGLFQLPRGIYAVSAGSAGGALEIIDSNLKVCYRPKPGFVGLETFEYTLVNARGAMDSATITLHVAPAPVPSEPPRFSSDEAWRHYVLGLRAQNLGTIAGYHYEIEARNYVPDAEPTPDSPPYTTSYDDFPASQAVTDGQYVYSLTGRWLTAIDARNPAAPQPVSALETPKLCGQMLLDGDRLILVRSRQVHNGATTDDRGPAK